MLPAAQLPAVLAALPPVEYRQNLFRSTLPRYIAGPTPISGIGAKLRGARYTPVGSFETIYFAEEPLTAFREFHHINLQLMHDMDDPFAARLAVVATLIPQVTLEPIQTLDLTRREVRAALATDLSELTGPWRVWSGPGLPPTQLLGQEAHSSGLFQAIRFPSARNPNGNCVAIFPHKLAPTGSIDLDDSRNGGPKQRI